LKDPAVALLSRLVTPSGTRNIVSKEELVSRVHEEEHIEQNIIERALGKLEVKTKLVIREQRHGNALYEIVSEFLIPWIIQQRTERAARIKHREWEEIAQHKGYARGQSTKDVPELTRQHLAIMTAGVHPWNEWRQQNPEIRPNLSRVRLNELDLTGANLEETVLTDSELRGVKLTGANLAMADLSGARLDVADLREVNLEGANLFNAALGGANLTNASLRNANLAGASLVGALLKGADLRNIMYPKNWTTH
jgi:hypothetical protein